MLQNLALLLRIKKDNVAGLNPKTLEKNVGISGIVFVLCSFLSVNLGFEKILEDC